MLFSTATSTLNNLLPGPGQKNSPTSEKKKKRKQVAGQHWLRLSACFCTQESQTGNQGREDLLLITREEGVGEIFLFMRCKQALQSRSGHMMPSYHEPFLLA